MDENLKINEENEELSFEQMLEESLKNLDSNSKVKGTVVSIAPNEIQVDVGRKQAGFVPVHELTDNPNLKPEDVVKIGDEIDLIIMRTNDQEGTIMLSKKRVDSEKAWEKIIEASETGEILNGIISKIIKGGVIASVKGCRVFIPASQTGLNRNANLEDLLKKEVRFKIIEVNENRRRAVASMRAVLDQEKKKAEDAFWNDIEIGRKYTGPVKSITAYGAFVDLGGIDGMIHISELSWSRIKHPSEILKVGDVVEVYIKDFDKEKRRIALGYRKIEDNPWEVFKRDYKIGDKIDVKIVNIAQFGAFARIIPGVDGLIHISEISDKHIAKPQDTISVGDEVKVLIKDIDLEKKRISLSIKDALEQNLNTEEK